MTVMLHTCSNNLTKVSIVDHVLLFRVTSIFLHQKHVLLWAQHYTKQLVQTSVKLGL